MMTEFTMRCRVPKRRCGSAISLEPITATVITLALLLAFVITMTALQVPFIAASSAAVILAATTVGLLRMPRTHAAITGPAWERPA